MNPEYVGTSRRRQLDASYGVDADGSRVREFELTSSSTTVTISSPKLPANRCDLGACLGLSRQLACLRKAFE